ncbi:sensor histidine kinase [Actinokineospora soli]|uniref:histidine kinase n=1 Tax=Actinokineospora soli TaxID=1048753 RepID=A0ABW2TKQ0_9PSEU
MSLGLLVHGGVLPAVPGQGRVDALGVLLVAAATAPIAVWRRAPLTVFACTGTACVLLVATGFPVDVVVGPAVALYLVAAGSGRETAWTRRTAAVVAVVAGLYAAAAAFATGSVVNVGLLHTGLAWAVAWFAGERTRLRRAHLDDLRRRAERAEHEAEQDRELAAARERARIARDLHDSAGHAISLIAVRAGAARLRQDPERSLRTLAAIEELARQTAGELDRLVGTLREAPPAAVEDPVGLASLATLVDRHDAAGLTVHTGITGTPRDLRTAVDQSAYRIIQEALTNAARHGTGTARLDLVYADTALELTITNPVGAGATAGGGHGLIGMRERAALLDGHLDTERANGIFRVRARLPYGAPCPPS